MIIGHGKLPISHDSWNGLPSGKHTNIAMENHIFSGQINYFYGTIQ